MTIRFSRFTQLLMLVLLGTTSLGCSSMMLDISSSLPAPPPIQEPEPQLLRLSVLVTPTSKKVIPVGSRIVVASIGSEHVNDWDSCSAAVKDSLMQRLIENADYQVLSRDDLDFIFNELDNNWSGLFNTSKVAKLGQLLGASYFVVGRVAYCGFTSNFSPDSDSNLQYSIFATLQIIHMDTGRMVVSSAGEGHFVPRSGALASLLDLPIDAVEEQEPKSQLELFRARGRQVRTFFKDLTGTDLDLPAFMTGAPDAPDSSVRREVDEGDLYQIFKASQDLANTFADDYFARQVWKTVEMWNDTRWAHADAVDFVRLGDCPQALRWIEEEAHLEAPEMNQVQLGRYLHNYGVVLLCANQPDRAVDKLNSAYRLGYNQSTLRMLGLARKAQEWALRAEEDEQPEVDELIDSSDLGKL